MNPDKKERHGMKNFSRAKFEKNLDKIISLIFKKREERVCKNCKYFQEMNIWGYCKFNPPRTRIEQRYKHYYGHSEPEIKLIEELTHTEWTQVSEYDWCGQYKKKERF